MIICYIVIKLQASRRTVNITLPLNARAILKIAAMLIIIINIIAKLSLTAHSVQLIFSCAEVAAGDINRSLSFVYLARNDIDNAALSTTAIKRTSTAAQHFNAFNIIHIVGQGCIEITGIAALELIHTHTVN